MYEMKRSKIDKHKMSCNLKKNISMLIRVILNFFKALIFLISILIYLAFFMLDTLR